MFTSIGAPEILLIIVVILVLFGADKLPEIANSVGKGMDEFRKASDNLKDEINSGKQEFNDTYRSTFEDTWDYDSEDDYEEDYYEDKNLYENEDTNDNAIDTDDNATDTEDKDNKQNSN